MKVSKRNQKYISTVGSFIGGLIDEHPDQVIQDQWIMWKEEGDFTYDRYMEFMDWRSEWLLANPID